MAEKTVVKKSSSKSKKWFTVFAPKILGGNEIGEVAGGSDSEMIGRKLVLPFSTVTGNLSKYYIKLKLNIKSASEDKAETEVVGYELAKSYLLRLTRRRSSKVDDFLDVKLGDKNLRIKLIAITVFNADNSQRTALRKVMKTEFLRALKGTDLENFIVALSVGKIQKEIVTKLKKLFPIRFVEVNKIEQLPAKVLRRGNIKDMATEIIPESVAEIKEDVFEESEEEEQAMEATSEKTVESVPEVSEE